MFHLNGHANKTWRNRITFLIWYSVAPPIAHEDFKPLSVFHEHLYGEHCIKTALPISPTACGKSAPKGK
jgi:hypothetical protein